MQLSPLPRQACFDRLNVFARNIFERAVVHCKLLHHERVDLAHVLAQLLAGPDRDLDIPRMMQFAGLHQSKDVLDQLDQALRPKSDPPSAQLDFSQSIDSLVVEAWFIASLRFNVDTVRTGHLLLAMFARRDLHGEMESVCPTLASINPDSLAESFVSIVAGSREDNAPSVAPRPFGNQSASYTRDIFICYRRSEGLHLAGRLSDRLGQIAGQHRVFRDLHSMALGASDIRRDIDRQIQGARVVIALIGPHWVSGAAGGGLRMLQDSDDCVRLEIESALAHKRPLIPITFDGATPPNELDLPSTLRPLLQQQFFDMRDEASFRSELLRLELLLKTLVAHFG